MRKVYYIYNPKTRTYDRIYPTIRQRALSMLRRLFVGMGLGAGFFIVLYLNFPKFFSEGLFCFRQIEGLPSKQFPLPFFFDFSLFFPHGVPAKCVTSWGERRHWALSTRQASSVRFNCRTRG